MISSLGLQEPAPYQEALGIARKMLGQSETLDEQVEEYLGTEISALRSVPTAVFCFLRAQQNIELPGIQVLKKGKRLFDYTFFSQTIFRFLMKKAWYKYTFLGLFDARRYF
jgi:hypothetical protein